MDGVIIAAGMGSRLNGVDCPKPMAKVGDKSLIEHIIDNLIAVGVNRIFVVTGYMHNELELHIQTLNTIKKCQLKTLYNPNWQEANGLSVLTAKNHVESPFLLTMADHLFTQPMLVQVIKQSPEPGEVILAVDNDVVDNPLVDLDDVTRVKISDDKIINIGKHIDDYNAFDTGIFFSSDGLFKAIEKSAQEGDTSLSGGMRVLRSEGKAKVKVVTQAQWVDVDTPEMLEKAKQLVDKGII